MGTRSLTHIIQKYDDTSETLVTFYKQFDGYPTGYGLELAEWLSKVTLVNGIGLNADKVIANGMGCLAAQLISHFKTEAGGIYIYPPDSTDCGEEYVYTISFDGDELSPKGGKLMMRCYDVYEKKALFDGEPKNFIKKFGKVKI